ncbi:MAG: cytidine deaminase [Spirochaetia bacterium]
MQEKKLQQAAIEIAQKAYSPYSGFQVGAAILCDNGQIVVGVNVENPSFGATICAEQNAVTTAISLGIRQFTAIAIYSPHQKESFLTPCGICRQVLSEFMLPDTPIYMADAQGNFIMKSLQQIFPFSFSLK